MSGRLALKVAPKAGRNAVTGWHDGQLKVSVTAAPDKGKANQVVVELMAKVLDVPKSTISIVRGQTSTQKVIEINGLDDGEVLRRAHAATA